MATYNSLEITFTNDWVETDRLSFITTLGASTYQGGIWLWVATRSNSFEVTTGTATGTAGERAAIQFKAAFDLDYATGYTTTQVSNVVTIESETVGEDFSTPTTPGGNTGTATFVVDNSSTPAPVADFSGTPTSGDASLEVDFTDTSTNTPTSWAWTFGDGGTSTQQNPTKTYASAGTYDVSLTATNSGGNDTETKVGYITVTEPPAPTPETVEVILCESPYYIFTPFTYTTTTGLTIELYIWSGDFNIPPASATETLTKVRPSVDYEEFNIDIAKTVQDQLEPVPVIDLSSSSQLVDDDSESTKWVKWIATYTDGTEAIPDIEGQAVAIDGYGYMQEGVNPEPPSNMVLTSVDFRKVDRTGFILLPFINNGAITSFDIDSDNGNINDNLVVSTSYENNEYIQYICVDVSQATDDDNIVITANPGGDEFTYQIIDECIYTPKNIVFKNKFGKYENLTMFKKSVENLKVEKKQFKNNYISGGIYDVTRHQIKDLNVIGNEFIKCNSGFISEDENELYKQLMLSDNIYIYENDSFTPIKIVTSNLEIKTRRNDQVINYTMEFEYAFNTKNNI